jgi:hypothetical protein
MKKSKDVTLIINKIDLQKLLEKIQKWDRMWNINVRSYVITYVLINYDKFKCNPLNILFIYKYNLDYFFP